MKTPSTLGEAWEEIRVKVFGDADEQRAHRALLHRAIATDQGCALSQVDRLPPTTPLGEKGLACVELLELELPPAQLLTGTIIDPQLREVVGSLEDVHVVISPNGEEPNSEVVIQYPRIDIPPCVGVGSRIKVSIIERAGMVFGTDMRLLG